MFRLSLSEISSFSSVCFPHTIYVAERISLFPSENKSHMLTDFAMSGIKHWVYKYATPQKDFLIKSIKAFAIRFPSRTDFSDMKTNIYA